MNTEEKSKHLIELFGKELALKVVDELLGSMPTEYSVFKDDGTNFINAYNYYWGQVKHYIKNVPDIIK